MILCYKCGVPIEPKLVNMCDRCTFLSVSMSSKIRRTLSVESCRSCERYHTPPKTWNNYEWGSRELLIYLIKRNTSLDKFEIVDSNFVYTEEHSKRMKISVTIEDNGVREDILINYSIKNKQCSDCEKVEAKQHWKAIVQVRHKAEHKRLFLHLEQLIIKHKAYGDTTNIKTRSNGIDFYFSGRMGAVKLVKFLEGIFPVKVLTSERLISKDIQNSKSNYKFSFSVDIVPFYTDDLLVLDKQFANSLGISTVVLVKKLANTISLFDFTFLKTVKLNANQYFNNKDKFSLLCTSKQLVKFTIIEIDKPVLKKEDCLLVPISVTRNDVEVQETKTHLGKEITDEDILLGYDLTNMNNSNKTEACPDIVIVRKEPNRDVQWKNLNEEPTDEHFYYLEDIKTDKEIVANLCDLPATSGGMTEEIEKLLV
ncbi:60S ribosomal export protein NMD3 [Nosema granulosis]|uniref:60S ribosomal export protein NMD3 n=1 Tax=Nosema granulosis TaxID=83296 RepID=A0A9P6H0Y0_9MICR|nr:60S ribosomal export protein NMD3 [Nosema granulosis]